MRALATWLVLLLALGPAPLAAAAPPSRTTKPAARPATTSAQSPKPDAGEKQARAHFKKAERAFNLGKFAEALVSYQAAFEAKPLPAFVFNIAQCHRNLDDPERALFFYRRYLALEPEGPHRKLVEGLIEEQQAKLSEKAAAEEAARTAERAGAVEPGAPGEPGAGGELDLGRAGRQGPGDPVAGSLTRDVGPAPPLYKRWWVWAAAGSVVAVTAAALLIKREGPAPRGSLGVADLRGQ